MIKASIPWTAKQMCKMYANGCLKFDNVIQRNEVWDNKKMSMFIDSIVRGFPIPPIFTIKTNDTVKDNRGRDIACFDCIDGKQRSTTVYKYRNNEFVLSGLEAITLEDGSEIELNGLAYDELPEEIREAFDTYTFNVYYFTDITDEEVAEMMWRLNNGKPLSGVEKSRIKAKDLDGIMELGMHELFSEYLTETALRGYNNEDIVIKNYIQYATPDDPSFDTKRTREVYAEHEFTADEKAQFNGLYKKTWEILAFIEAQCPKKVFRKACKKTNILAILKLSELDIPSDVLAERVGRFFTTEDNSLSVDERYNDASKNGTNHAANVKLRNDIIREYVTSFSS